MLDLFKPVDDVLSLHHGTNQAFGLLAPGAGVGAVYNPIKVDVVVERSAHLAGIICHEVTEFLPWQYIGISPLVPSSE